MIDDFGSYRAGTSATGDGRALSLPLGPLEEDSVVVVLATRSHRAGPLATPGKQIQSVVILTTPRLQLVEPDASRVLELEPADQGLTRVKNGQRGVFYELRTAPADPLLAQVYFHKPDKGIGEPGAPDEGLRLGVDFAVAHDTAIDLPHVDLRDVPSRTKLVVRARRAMSGVTRDLTHVVKVP